MDRLDSLLQASIDPARSETLAIGLDIPGVPCFFRWREKYLHTPKDTRRGVIEGLPACDHIALRFEAGREANLWHGILAWNALRPGGRLLVAGNNEHGAKTTIDRFSKTVEVEPEEIRSQAHGRLAIFIKTDSPPLPLPVSQTFAVSWKGKNLQLESGIGGFAAGHLDAGTAILLEHLASEPPAKTIIDLCSGSGVLGLSALAFWSTARCAFLDADALAIAACKRNCANLGVTDRSDIHWWDAGEPPQTTAKADLVLLNPPWHADTEVDLALAHRVLSHLPNLVAPNGWALIVANRRLPYEAILGRQGICTVRVQAKGFKVVCWQPTTEVTEVVP